MNHARTPSCHSGGDRARSRRRCPRARSCSKSRWKAAASSGESTTTITFSWRAHESSVQFVEPVQTDRGRGRRTCGASGRARPAIGNASTGSDSISASSGEDGGGTGIGPRVVDVVGEPDVDAAAGRAADRVADDRGRLRARGRSRTGRARASARRRRGTRRSRRDLARRLAAVGQSTDRDVGLHRAPRRRQDRRDVQLLPGRRPRRTAARAARGATSRRGATRAVLLVAEAPGLPRRPRLGDPAHLRAPAHRRRARPRRRPRSSTARSTSSASPTTCCSGTSCPTHPGDERSNRRPTPRRDRGRAAVRARARARAAASSPSAGSPTRRSAARTSGIPSRGGAADFRGRASRRCALTWYHRPPADVSPPFLR